MFNSFRIRDLKQRVTSRGQANCESSCITLATERGSMLRYAVFKTLFAKGPVTCPRYINSRMPVRQRVWSTSFTCSGQRMPNRRAQA